MTSVDREIAELVRDVDLSSSWDAGSEMNVIVSLPCECKGMCTNNTRDLQFASLRVILC